MEYECIADGDDWDEALTCSHVNYEYAAEIFAEYNWQDSDRSPHDGEELIVLVRREGRSGPVRRFKTFANWSVSAVGTTEIRE